MSHKMTQNRGGWIVEMQLEHRNYEQWVIAQRLRHFSIRHRKLGSSSFEIENKVSTFLADLRDFKIQREII